MSALTWTVYSFLSLVRRILTEPEPQSSPVAISTFPNTIDWWSISYELTATVLAVFPVLLVIHLVRRSDGTVRPIGLDSERPRADVLFGLALLAISLALSFGALRLGDALSLPIRDMILVNQDAHPVYMSMFIINSARAALTEEIIATGYLIHRLIQIDRSPWVAAIACGVLRGAYHLYQGEIVFLGHLITGIIAGWIFLRTRRLWPLIVAHFSFDAVNYFGAYILGPIR